MSQTLAESNALVKLLVRRDVKSGCATSEPSRLLDEPVEV